MKVSYHCSDSQRKTGGQPRTVRARDAVKRENKLNDRATWLQFRGLLLQLSGLAIKNTCINGPVYSQDIICIYKNPTNVNAHNQSGQCQQTYLAALWSIVPSNEPLINASDKWCSKTAGCPHRDSGEHINPITWKGMDPPIESGRPSHAGTSAGQTSVGQGQCWWDWTVLISINSRVKRAVRPHHMRKCMWSVCGSDL